MVSVISWYPLMATLVAGFCTESFNFFFRTEMFSNKYINASINSKLKQKERPEAHVIDRADG